MALTIVIQSGGESRRMGQDKALLPFLGQPLIVRVIDRLRPFADELIITTNQPEKYGFLGVPLVGDKLPGRGALGGLYTALSAASQPLVAVVACDMPFASAPLLQAQRAILEKGPYDAAIPRSANGLEPFHAVYRRDTCLPLVEEALKADKWRVDAWFAKANIYFFKPEETLRYDPQQLAYSNVNTPEEFSQAETLAKGEPPAD